MKKPKQKPQNKKKQIVRVAIRVVIALIILGLIAALVVWILWPVRHTSLQTADVRRFNFITAQAEVAKINETEAVQSVRPECYSKLYLHEQPTTKAVVMFHGVSVCSLQFSGLAKYFYDRGYNVYSPLAPEHGRPDNLNHAKVSTQGLIDYVNTSVNITSTLGNEVGVIGLSGGGNLATWAAQYRPETKRLLALSPFYEPSASQAPKWQIRPLLVLYGNNLLPDQLNKPEDPQHALSYRALSKYVTIFKNLPKPAQDTRLENIAVVMADDDKEIDQPLALKTLGSIAKANHKDLNRYQLPAELKLGHDIVSPENEFVVKNQAFLYQKYFSLYEQ